MDDFKVGDIVISLDNNRHIVIDGTYKVRDIYRTDILGTMLYLEGLPHPYFSSRFKKITSYINKRKFTRKVI